MKSKNTIKKDCSLIRKWIRKGVADTHSNGFFWFNNKLLPAVERIKTSSVVLKYFELLSDTFYLVGDIYDFNTAPRSAIKAYKESIFYNKNNSAAWRELGGQLDCIGNSSQAIKCLKKAIVINPNDEYAKDDLEAVEFQKGKKKYSVGQKTLFKWNACDLVAEKKYNKLLEMFNGKQSLNAVKFRATVKGLLGDINGCKEEWHRLIKVKSMINFTYGDWFYMPDKVLNSPEIWLVIWAVRERISFKNNIFISHDSLSKILKEKIKNTSIRIKKERELIIKFNLARTRQDLVQLKRFVDLYPKWLEAKNCFEDLKCY
jgi:tetratricopeptide (TPR) repeat protein